MKNNKPKRPLLTAGLVVSIFAIILSWTELGVPLSILAAALSRFWIRQTNSKCSNDCNIIIHRRADTYKFNELKR